MRIDRFGSFSRKWPSHRSRPPDQPSLAARALFSLHSRALWLLHTWHVAITVCNMRPTSAQGGFCEDIPYIFYVGNEGGDLDSIVSSIGAAYIRNRGRGAAIHIPIMCATDPASSGTHAKLHLSA